MPVLMGMPRGSPETNVSGLPAGMPSFRWQAADFTGLTFPAGAFVDETTAGSFMETFYCRGWPAECVSDSGFERRCADAKLVCPILWCSGYELCGDQWHGDG